MMKKKEMLSKLEETFASMDIDIKYDRLKTDGGHCRYKDREYIIINRILPISNRIELLKSILREKIEKDGDVYVMPAVREMLEEDNDED